MQVAILKHSNTAKLHQSSPWSLGLTLKWGIYKHCTTKLKQKGWKHKTIKHCPAAPGILHVQKFPSLRSSCCSSALWKPGAPAWPAAWNPLSQNKAHFKNLLHSINSCESTRRRVECCRKLTTHLPGSITTGCDTTRTSDRLRNKPGASSSHLARGQAGSNVSAGTSVTTARAAGTARSHSSPAHAPLSAGWLQYHPWLHRPGMEPPPRPSGHGRRWGAQERGDTPGADPKPPGEQRPLPASKLQEARWGHKGGQESCRWGDHSTGAELIAPGTACMYIHNYIHAELPANPPPPSLPRSNSPQPAGPSKAGCFLLQVSRGEWIIVLVTGYSPRHCEGCMSLKADCLHFGKLISVVLCHLLTWPRSCKIPEKARKWEETI